MRNLYTINDNELLNFLLISDFDDVELTTDIQKFLLLKFKFFYRIQYGRNKNLKDELELKTFNFNEDMIFLKRKSYESQIKMDNAIKELDDLTKSLINRKLTFKERWKGKLT